MENQPSGFHIRLGLFIMVGLALFIAGIFLIGRQKNLFNPVFRLTTTFNSVGGLQVGNNVRFSGINVGTVNKIKIINDSTVQVDMLIKKGIQQFIKTDCIVSIGSEGVMGDKLVNISQGNNAPEVKEGQHLESTNPVDMDAVFSSLSTTAANAEVITDNLAQILTKVNSGGGTLGRLIEDSTVAKNFTQTVANLKKGSKGLNEDLEAAKHNILLRGYFKKKRREAEKQKKEEQKKTDEEDQKKQ